MNVNDVIENYCQYRHINKVGWSLTVYTTIMRIVFCAGSVHMEPLVDDEMRVHHSSTGT